MHLLVVDDEPDLEPLMRQLYRRPLRSGEVELTFAEDGVAALSALDRHSNIDLVLTDLNMPRMDGLTLLGKLAAMDRLLKAIVVTAYGDLANIRTAMNRGAFDFVTKPIDFDDFETTIYKSWRAVQAAKQAARDQQQLTAFQKELDVARRIQEAVLVRDFPERSDVDLHAFMAPALGIGGDFYDFFFLDDHRVGVAIGDVAGKGISAALFMAISLTLLKGVALRNEPPAACLQTVNRLLHPQSLAHMFVTMFYGILDTRTGAFEYCNAGHTSPYLIRTGGTVTPLARTNGVAVSLINDFDYTARHTTLEPGDSLFLFTDGVTEAMNARRQEFSTERLETLLRAPASSAATLVQHVADAVTEHAGAVPQSDDVTMLAARYKARS